MCRVLLSQARKSYMSAYAQSIGPVSDVYNETAPEGLPPKIEIQQSDKSESF